MFLTWRCHIALWETNWLFAISWHWTAQTKQRLKEDEPMMKVIITAALKTTCSRWGYEYPAHLFPSSETLNQRVLSVHHAEWRTGLCWMSWAAFPWTEGQVVLECGLDGAAAGLTCVAVRGLVHSVSHSLSKICNAIHFLSLFLAVHLSYTLICIKHSAEVLLLQLYTPAPPRFGCKYHTFYYIFTVLFTGYFKWIN